MKKTRWFLMFCAIAFILGTVDVSSAAPRRNDGAFLVKTVKGCTGVLTYREFAANATAALYPSGKKGALPSPTPGKFPAPSMKRVHCFNECDAAEGECAAYCDTLPPGEIFACYQNCFWAHEYCYCDCGWSGGICG